MRLSVLVLSSVACGLVGGTAAADELKDAATKVTECRQITDSVTRLTCLDSAAAALSLVLEGAPQSTAVVEAPAAPAAVSEEPEEPKWARAPKPRKVPEPKVEVAENTPKEKKPPLWARVLRPDDGSADDLYAVNVIRITRNGAGRIFFYTEEGQVWRQTQLVEVKPPKTLPAGAVIQRSLTGSPKISFDDVPGKSYRVRRVE